MGYHSLPFCLAFEAGRKTTLQCLCWLITPLLFILGAITILIFFQPDLSAAITILALGIMMFFLGGGNWKQIVALFIFVFVVGLIGINVYATGRARVAQYLSGLQDPTASSYHIRRTFEAVIKGGFFGVGLGGSQHKIYRLAAAPPY